MYRLSCKLILFVFRCRGDAMKAIFMLFSSLFLRSKDISANDVIWKRVAPVVNTDPHRFSDHFAANRVHQRLIVVRLSKRVSPVV